MDIQIGEDTFQTPDSWNEMSLKQQYYALEVLSAPIPPTADYEIEMLQKLNAIAIYLLGITPQYVEEYRLHCMETKDEMYFIKAWRELIELVTSCVVEKKEVAVEGEAEPQLVYSTKLNLTKCPYPIIDMGALQLLAPDDTLKNATFGEVIQLLTYWQRFNKKGDYTLINKSLATIYRQAKAPTKENIRANYDGDRREKYNPFAITIRENFFILTDAMVKRLLWFWLTCCLQEIIRLNESIFNPQESKHQYSDYYKKQLAQFGYAGLVMAFSKEEGIPRDKLIDMNYREVFANLKYNEILRQAEEDLSQK